MKRKKTLIIILIVASIMVVLGIVAVMAVVITKNKTNTVENTPVEDNVVEDIVDDSELFDAPPPSDEEIEDDEENIDDSEVETNNIPEEGTEQQIDDMAKLIFNSNFVSYRRTINGVEFNELIQKIKDSNEANPNHRVALTSNNLQDLNGIIETNKYKVEFSYDDQGYVNNITVDQIIDTENTVDQSTSIDNINNDASVENEI